MNRDTHPTFLLRGINHEEILKAYLNGEYDTMGLSSIPKKPQLGRIKAIKHVQETGVGKDDQCAVYDKVAGSSTFRVFTTNAGYYKPYVMDIDTSEEAETAALVINKAVNCDYCRQPITLIPLVVPIRSVKKEGKLVVSGTYIVGHSCCALAIIREQNRLNPQNSQYRDSEQILKNVVFLLTGIVPTRQAPDWKLLEANGGSMEASTYYDSDIVLEPNPNVVFTVAKTQWDAKK